MTENNFAEPFSPTNAKRRAPTPKRPSGKYERVLYAAGWTARDFEDVVDAFVHLGTPFAVRYLDSWVHAKFRRHSRSDPQFRFLTESDLRKALATGDELAIRFPDQVRFWFIDSDFPGKERTDQRLDDIDRLSRKLRSLGLPHVRRSTRSGACHFLGRIAGPEVDAQKVRRSILRILRDRLGAKDTAEGQLAWHQLHLEVRLGQNNATEFPLTWGRSFLDPTTGEEIVINSPESALLAWQMFLGLRRCQLRKIDRLAATKTKPSPPSVLCCTSQDENVRCSSQAERQVPQNQSLTGLDAPLGEEPTAPWEVHRFLENLRPVRGKRDAALWIAARELHSRGLAESVAVERLEAWVSEGGSERALRRPNEAARDVRRVVRHAYRRALRPSLAKRSWRLSDQEAAVAVFDALRSLGRKPGNIVEISSGFICKVCGWSRKNRRRVAAVLREMQQRGLISDSIYPAWKGNHGRSYVFDSKTFEEEGPPCDSEDLSAYAEWIASEGGAA